MSVVDPALTKQDRRELLSAIAERAAHRERHDIEPREQIELLRRSGYTTLTLPEDLGGIGGTASDLIEFVVELAEADPIVAHILRAHYLQIQLVRRLPEGAAKRRWASEIADGRLFGNAAGEREGTLGSSPLSTRLEPCPSGGWRLSGTKFYCTGTSYSDFVAVVAQLDDERGARVVLPVDRAGIEIVDDWDGIGQNRTGTGTTTLLDVQVDEADFLVVEDPNRVQVASDAPLMQLYLQAIMVGCLSAGLSDARNLLRSRRRTFDNAPSQQPTRDPLLLAELGKAAAAAFAARSTVMAAARDIDRAYASYFNGDASPSMFARASESAALAKVHVDELALTTATSLFDVGGASGASRERNLDRHWRSIRTLTLHNPAAYKALALGDLFVNDTPLPANGYF